MQTASALARPARTRPAIDLNAEMAYWQDAHASGRLGQHGFSDYSLLLKMGYDVYLAYPRATEAQLYRVLQESYHLLAPSLSVPWDEARWLVRHAWHHLEQSASSH
ncbi:MULTISPECIES: hypothetical protein [unclassified Xanthomonas]|uniref:hypothetical protein n=1 Tax=unclassified Xanthomonas TaxID=2643310 RepID=UPI0028676FD3|nr:hypothetical protein [Xanthomonas sp. CFBP 8443]MDR6674453.1 hypothetical protein [Xanthomonas translucens]MEB1529535.1 hypothetical protein [Xanthomonas campestris pv. campestris]